MISIRIRQGSGSNLGHLSGPRETIGWGKRADWTLKKGPDVDGEHAAIFVQDEMLWIEDLGSKAGTLVNGDRIDAPRRLLASDTVRIGQATITFSGFLPDGRIPAGSLFDSPRSQGEELELEMRRNDTIRELTADAAQALAYAWCDRVSRVRLAGAMEAVGLSDEASTLRRSPRVTDRETSMAMHARLRGLVDLAQRMLQTASDAKRPQEDRDALERLLHALRSGRDALRASVAPYGGNPGFAVMIGFDEHSEPPPDDAEHRTAHALPRAGVVAGEAADAARILELDLGIAEVREQVKEVLEARSR